MSENKILVAGPWVGELGWELFCWQGYIRKMSERFEKTFIVSRSGMEFLYQDFYDGFIPYNSPTSLADMWMGKYEMNEINTILSNTNADIYQPPINIGYGVSGGKAVILSDNFYNQKFIKYSSDSIDEQYDIILHPRNKMVGNNRNWDKENWQKLVDKLSVEYKIAIIGNNEAFNLDGVKDYRNIPIKDSVSLLNRCKLMVGQSSGPLHLASLCGTPHLVWSDESNRDRYLTHWNPHNTKVFFHAEMGWNPTVDFIYNKIIGNINEL
jgi:hypothetical protein